MTDAPQIERRRGERGGRRFREHRERAREHRERQRRSRRSVTVNATLPVDGVRRVVEADLRPSFADWTELGLARARMVRSVVALPDDRDVGHLDDGSLLDWSGVTFRTVDFDGSVSIITRTEWLALARDVLERSR